LHELLSNHKRYLDCVKKLYEQSVAQKKVKEALAKGEKFPDPNMPSAKER